MSHKSKDDIIEDLTTENINLRASIAVHQERAANPHVCPTNQPIGTAVLDERHVPPQLFFWYRHRPDGPAEDSAVRVVKKGQEKQRLKNGNPILEYVELGDVMVIEPGHFLEEPDFDNPGRAEKRYTLKTPEIWAVHFYRCKPDDADGYEMVHQLNPGFLEV
jgi:hypothetical protein